MTPKTLGFCTVGAMLLTSLTVYSITPEETIGPERTTSREHKSDRPKQGDDHPTGSDVAASLSAFEDGETITIKGRLGHSSLLRGQDGETFLFLEVAGNETAQPRTSAPAHLALVIDRSGSMRGQRMANAKAAALSALGGLKDGDTISVVSFDTQPRIEVAPTRIDSTTRRQVEQNIQNIQLGGDTCISCGLEQGLIALRQAAAPVNRMILLSDGDTNNGIRDVAGFRSLAQRAGGQGVEITTIGVDIDYNEKILSAVAQDSAGRHYFVEQANDLPRIFEQEAQALARSLASGVEVAIDLAPGVEVREVFDRNFTRFGNQIRVPLGAFSQGDRKTILLSLTTPAASGDELRVANVSMQYEDLVLGRPASCGGELASELTSDFGSLGPLDALVAGRLNRTRTAAALREANDLAASGQLADARDAIERQKSELRDAAKVAARAAPQPVAASVALDFDEQLDVLDAAESGFATPPPAPAAAAGPSPANPFSGSDEGKRAIRLNEENAFRQAF